MTLVRTRLKARVTLRSRSFRMKRPLLALIPGGPGLSSRTLKGIESCDRFFDLAFVDPPGTGGLPEPRAATFEAISDSIVTALAELKRPAILLGHSFGGLYAAQALSQNRIEVAGLVLMSTPLRPESYALASRQYEKHKSRRLSEAESRWEAERDDASFRRWIASYGELYFSRSSCLAKGSRLLASDRTSAASCLSLAGAMSDKALSSRLIAAVRAYRGRKLFIAGERDLLYPIGQLRRDAKRATMDFRSVPNAGHFPAFEQPARIAKLLRDYFVDVVIPEVNA
jgi:pimeloyl-ACP methyl ester carboxylesterase